MKDLEKELEKSVWEIIIDLQREVRELEEENKKLKEELKDFNKLIGRLERTEEENKKLKETNESQNEEIQRFKDNAMADMTEITDLEIENKKLKHENKYRAGIVDILPKWKGHIAEETIQDLQARINELKETIKDHQLYEEKLEHRIIELEELLHWE